MMSGVTVVTNSCAFYLAHEAAAHRAPGIPGALCFQSGETVLQNPGALRRGNAKLRLLAVIARSDLSAVAQRAKAEATKQSILGHSVMVRRTRTGISRFRVRAVRAPE